MPTTIQILDVPDDVRRTLTSRANLSLSDYCLRLISVVAARPSHDEIMARLNALPPITTAERPGGIRADRY